MPVSETRFMLEVDGVTAVVATEATPPGFKHTPVKYKPGNQPRPTHIRGDFEIEEMTFKHARTVGQAGQQLFRWLLDYASGALVVKKNVRFITMDEAGRTPVEIWECQDCVPTQYKPDQSSGTGNNVATFSFSLQPTEARLI